MTVPLRLLIVDDSEDDAELLALAVKSGGYDLTCQRVQTASSLAQALEGKTWDIILSDYSMPGFNALDALAVLQKTKLDIPFLVVSGTMGEDTAVKVMKAGAQDYLMKDKLLRLLPAVERELKEAAQRAKQREIEDELKLKSEQLVHAQKIEAVGRLAAGIAHDFNNVLCAIIMHCDSALDVVGEESSAKQSIAQIKHAAEHAALLTKQLLVFSGKHAFEPKVLNVNEVVLEIEKMVKRIVAKNIAIETNLGSNIKNIMVEPTQLGQLVMNLIVNARDAMPTGGKITIETKMVSITRPRLARNGEIKPGEYVGLSVADSGHGIDEDVKAKLFEPFFTTKGQGKGTGLGLSMVYGVVKQSSAYIEVESKPGAGAKFEILFPVNDHPMQSDHKTPEQPASPFSATMGKATILIADDNVALRSATSSILTKKGFKVLEAGSGTEALKVVKGYEDPIHLLITDVVMPEMGGAELAIAVSAEKKGIKVLYVSSHRDDTIIESSLNVAGSHFLEKPFSSLALLQKVTSALSGS